MPAIGFANPVPWWVAVPLVVALLWVAWQAYARVGEQFGKARRLALVTLRSASLVLLAVLLMQPVLTEPNPDQAGRIVPILVDTSRSMGLADDGGPTRLAEARALVRDRLLPALKGGFQADVLSFGQRLSTADEPPQAEAGAARTDLGGALRDLRQRYRGQRLAGVVVISDGADTGPGDPIAAARDMGVPVYAIGAGSGTMATDREVSGVTASERSPVNALVRIGATVVGHGPERGSFDVRVLENGALSQVKTVAPVEPGIPVSVEFRVAPPKDGATVYTIEIPVAPGEVVEENNRRRVLVRPAGRRRRVLLLQATPGYDHSFLTRALLHDAAVELDTVVRKGRNDRGDATFYIQGEASRAASLSEGFPEKKEALFVYDALILANLDIATLPPEHLEDAADFVANRGGGLLVVGTRAFDNEGLRAIPLGSVLPVDLTDAGRAVVPTAFDADQPNRVLVTEEGSRHPIMQLGPSKEASLERWTEMPALAATAVTGRPRAGATVLARTLVPGRGASPLVVVQRYGNGRSMVFAGDGSWRWRMMRPSDDRTYETFWRQTIRWLAEGAPDPVSMSVPDDVVAGDDTRATVTVRDGSFVPVPNADVSVDVIAPDGRRESLPAGVTGPSTGQYATGFKAVSNGIYRLRARATVAGASLGTADEWVLVGGSDPEFVEPWLNQDLLRRVAEASGGRVLGEGEIGTLRDVLVSGAPDRAPPVVRALWHGPWTFLALVALLGTEWSLRRAWGLR